MDLHTSYKLLPGGPSTPTKGKRKVASTETDAQKGASFPLCPPFKLTLGPHTEEANKTFNALLKTELFGPDSLDIAALHQSPTRGQGTTTYAANSAKAVHSSPSSPASKPLFSFFSPSRKRLMMGERERDVGGAKGLDSPTHERYSVSPVRYESQKLLLSPRKATRLLSKVPFKVLDAPELAVRPFRSPPATTLIDVSSRYSGRLLP